MRRRAVREIGIIAGIAVLLLGLVIVNEELGRTSNKDRMEKLRVRIEQGKGEDPNLVRWSLLRETTGDVGQGPTFAPRLLPFRNKRVDLIGFMVGLKQFRHIREFLVLPVPIVCYFCQQPPMRDVMLVEMANGVAIPYLYKQPVLINGKLILNHGHNTKFFYVMKDAKLGAAVKGERLTEKFVPIQHTLHNIPMKKIMIKGEAPPNVKASGADLPVGKAATQP